MSAKRRVNSKPKPSSSTNYDTSICDFLEKRRQSQQKFRSNLFSICEQYEELSKSDNAQELDLETLTVFGKDGRISNDKTFLPVFGGATLDRFLEGANLGDEDNQLDDDAENELQGCDDEDDDENEGGDDEDNDDGDNDGINLEYYKDNDDRDDDEKSGVVSTDDENDTGCDNNKEHPGKISRRTKEQEEATAQQKELIVSKLHDLNKLVRDSNLSEKHSTLALNSLSSSVALTDYSESSGEEERNARTDASSSESSIRKLNFQNYDSSSSQDDYVAPPFDEKCCFPENESDLSEAENNSPLTTKASPQSNNRNSSPQPKSLDMLEQLSSKIFNQSSYTTPVSQRKASLRSSQHESNQMSSQRKASLRSSQRKNQISYKDYYRLSRSASSSNDSVVDQNYHPGTETDNSRKKINPPRHAKNVKRKACPPCEKRLKAGESISQLRNEANVENILEDCDASSSSQQYASSSVNQSPKVRGLRAYFTNSICRNEESINNSSECVKSASKRLSNSSGNGKKRSPSLGKPSTLKTDTPPPLIASEIKIPSKKEGPQEESDDYSSSMNSIFGRLSDESDDPVQRKLDISSADESLKKPEPCFKGQIKLRKAIVPVYNNKALLASTSINFQDVPPTLTTRSNASTPDNMLTNLGSQIANSSTTNEIDKLHSELLRSNNSRALSKLPSASSEHEANISALHRKKVNSKTKKIEFSDSEQAETPRKRNRLALTDNSDEEMDQMKHINNPQALSALPSASSEFKAKASNEKKQHYKAVPTESSDSDLSEYFKTKGKFSSTDSKPKAKDNIFNRKKRQRRKRMIETSDSDQSEYSEIIAKQPLTCKGANSPLTFPNSRLPNTKSSLTNKENVLELDEKSKWLNQQFACDKNKQQVSDSDSSEDYFRPYRSNKPGLHSLSNISPRRSQSSEKNIIEEISIEKKQQTDAYGNQILYSRVRSNRKRKFSSKFASKTLISRTSPKQSYLQRSSFMNYATTEARMDSDDSERLQSAAEDVLETIQISHQLTTSPENLCTESKVHRSSPVSNPTNNNFDFTQCMRDEEEIESEECISLD